VLTIPATRPWHEADDWTGEAERRGLAARERAIVDAFRRDGFVVVEDDRRLDELDVDGIWTRHATAFEPANGGRATDAWRIDAAVRGVATHPDVLGVLRLLYGREPVPFQTLNFLNGTEQRTHSDTIHFNAMPNGFMCGVWMALEDVTLRQGPLHYYAGSHRLPELDYEDLDVPAVDGPANWYNPNTATSYRVYEERIDGIARESGLPRAELAIRKGTFLVWAANLLHGGSPRDDRTLTRKSQVTHYVFEDVVPYTPMFSRRSLGAFEVRRVRDIRTGRWSLPSLDGTPVVFPRHEGTRRSIEPALTPAARLTSATMALHGRLVPPPRAALRAIARTIVRPRGG